MADRWATSPFIELPPPEYARTEYNGLVHLISGWIAFDTETQDDRESTSGPCEKPICDLFTSYGPPRPRCEGLVTCVACLAGLLKLPKATVT